MTIDPTLNDQEVLDFISKGYVIVEGLGTEKIHNECKTLRPAGISEFVQSEEFLREVILHPKVAGVARSLLGENFSVPISGHHHLFETAHPGQTWHSDGISEPGIGVTHLQCYYYPHEVGPEDGPTMALPGSHLRTIDREAIAHYQNILGQVSLTVPAGTLVMSHYTLWHKAGPKLNNRRRSMLKFSYFRTAQPQRDWITDADRQMPIHFPRQKYVGEIESYRDSVKCRRLWEWLCGDAGEWQPSHERLRIFANGRLLNDVLADLGE